MLAYSTPTQLSHIQVVHAEELEPPLIIIKGELNNHPVHPDNLEQCNCWLYVNNRLDQFGRMITIIPNSDHRTGTVAVEFFGEIKHVSLVTSVNESGVWVEEANYKRCEKGTRFIPFTKPSLVGFWTSPT